MSGDPAILRQARRTDIFAIQRVRHSVRENVLTSGTISDEDVRQAIEENGRGWVIETEDGEVVAFAVGLRTTGNVWALFVDPRYERRGYGRRLLDTMLSWLWEQGLEKLWLTTEANTRAQRVYEKAGWTNAGRTHHDEILFEMNRPQSPA